MSDAKLPKKRSRKKVLLILVNLFLIVVIVLAISWAVSTYFSLDKSCYTNDAQVEEYINPVNTRIAGYIKEVRFLEHQPVKKGDTLIIIDDREYRIQLQLAEAALLTALASRNVTTSAVSTVRSTKNVSDANIKSSQARLWNAEQNYRRYENLLKDDAATQQQFDQVKAEYQSLQAQTRALQEQRQTNNFSTEETSRKIYVNDGEIKRAEAAVEMARLNLSYTIITAPYDGFTARRNVQEGQLLQAGQTLVSFIRSGNKWVVANYKETQIAELKVGQKMYLSIDGVHSKKFIGRIAAMSQATGSRYSAVPVDNSTGNFVKVQQRIPVRIEFIEAENNKADMDLLKAGMNVEVTVAGKE